MPTASAIQTGEDKLVRLILGKYKLDATDISRPQKGYRNASFRCNLSDGRIANVILYKSEPDILRKIKCANQVSDYLAVSGMPTRQTLGPVIKIQASDTTRYAAIYNYLLGDTIPWEAYTKDHIKLLGAALSDVHWKLQSQQVEGMDDVAQESSRLLGRMRRYFGGSDVRIAMKEKLRLAVGEGSYESFDDVLTAAGQLPGKQPLHMDFVRGNILFQNASDVGLKYKVSGILDFEKTAYGHPAFDIARTLAFLLVDCKQKPEAKVRKYFLQSGYNKRGEAGFSAPVVGNVDIMESLVDFYLLHDLYKFLRHNPYESLHLNEHFLQTRDLLLQRRIAKMLQ